MANKGIFVAPVEILIDVDAVNEIMHHIDSALTEVDKHYEGTEEDKDNEKIIALAASLAENAFAMGMDPEVLIAILRKTFDDVLQGAESAGEELAESEEVEPPVSKKNVN